MKAIIVNFFQVWKSQKKIMEVSDECATDLHTIKIALKEFLSLLRVVCERGSESSEALFG